MPLFDANNMLSHALAGHFGFSAVPVDALGATEYTLAAIVADVSSSVGPFAADIEACVRRVVSACRRSPRADNLMLRTLLFNQRLSEVHGFKPLMDCAPDDYRDSIRCGGGTALYDATHNAIGSVLTYGHKLVEADLSCNAIVVVVTDGDDNSSSFGPRQVKQILQQACRDEELESIVTILVGVNVQSAGLSTYLSDFKDQAGFTGYLEIGAADEASLARLAGFIDRSISAQSRALGSGAAGALLSF